ncbi:hypothetical protein GCM10007979_33840 [Nocardioides albus]|uniref:Uncharacterized protein n=1 Tax=Nocardioides albus TaxID=1841 RepID=A0A7W5A8Q5_9ACTN|nr:hypothetical protein [Nocardioides albus]GGU32007.1 hypothetical protein GCM10007979_33840 [Nocardioides albus]
MRTCVELRWAWILNTYVRPFYLWAEWLPHDWAMARRVARAGKRVKVSDVRRMLHGSWRESSVAAWYCLRLPPELIESDLEVALGRAYSSKNAHTLAAPRFSETAQLAGRIHTRATHPGTAGLSARAR